MKNEGGAEGPLLFVVPTPIGNLDDITHRAVVVLSEVDHVVAEDTRRTRKLLAHLGVDGARLSRLDAHARPGDLHRVLGWMLDGHTVAVVTDAGMPAVSDPGAALVRLAVEHGIELTALPGASAVTTAAAASGLVDGPFYFAGFLPRTGSPRADAIAQLAGRVEPCVVFESPQRLTKTLKALSSVMPERQACVGRELSKVYEEYVWGSLSALANDERQWRGEITLVLGPGLADRTADVTDEQLEARIDAQLRAGKHTKTIATELAAWSGRGKRQVYEWVVRRQREAREAR